jgi:hypothetical protein
MSDPVERLRDKIDGPLREAFADEGQTDSRAGFVIDWILTCEVAGNDGELYLHTLRSKDLMVWKALGMAEAHAGDLRAAMLKEDSDE